MNGDRLAGFGVLRGLASRFRDSAAAVGKQPLLDPASHAVYTLVAVAGAVELAILLLTRFTFDNLIFLRLFVSLLAFLACGPLARRYGMPRIAIGLEALALPGLIGALIGTGTFMATAIAGPMQDDLLGRVDRMLGLDWVALFRIYRDHPEILPTARFAYFSMLPQLAIIPLALVVAGKDARAWVFLRAYAIAGVLTVVIYPFFPAMGPYVHYGITPSDLPGLGLRFPWTFGTTIEAIRAGEVTEISTSLSGLVSFPSFHAASGALLAWAVAPLRWLRVPSILLIVAMLCATVTVGSHYFIDVIAGLVVASASIAAATYAVSPTIRTRQALSADGVST